MRLHTLKELDSSEGTVQLHASGSDKTIILHPTPSATDPNDPLRWPRWRKHVAFAAVCGFTFFSNYGIGGLSPAFYILSLEFGKTQTQTTALLLWPILVFGLFNFFWVPIANYFGKRPVFVFANLLLGLCYIWGATAKSFESLLWSNIVAAFAGSATEALGAAMVNDLYFLHERAGMMGIYMNAISGGNTVGPLICGFVVESLGWRWHKWMAAIFTLANWLVVLFFVAEPRWVVQSQVLSCAVLIYLDTPATLTRAMCRPRQAAWLQSPIPTKRLPAAWQRSKSTTKPPRKYKHESRCRSRRGGSE